MLHIKFCENRPAGSGDDFLVFFTIYGCGGHLGHLTWISQSNFRYLYPWMRHIKFQFDWPCGFRERRSLKSVYVRQTGQGQEMTLT